MIDALIVALLTASGMLFAAGRASIRRQRKKQQRPWFTSTQRGWYRHTSRPVLPPSRRFEQ